MNPVDMLSAARTATLVVDSAGMIMHAVGGFGGFLDADKLPGTSVFAHLSPSDADELALYFLQNVETGDLGVAAQPMPFRVTVLDGDGGEHPSDVIPTGIQDDDGTWWWTVVVVPMSLSGSISRSLDLEMAGAPRSEVRHMLCEELAVDNTTYVSRWALIDLTGHRIPEVVTSRSEDLEVADAIATTIVANDWAPWVGMGEGDVRALNTDDFPEPLAALMDHRGWQRSVMAPVHADGELVAAFLMVGVVPVTYDRLGLKLNQVTRIGSLVRAAAMLMVKWRKHDQLIHAASTDPLTGLANRDAFFAALDVEHRIGALLYIDIDNFKLVNDRYGHSVGDSVLVEVATRISNSCRSDDIVARFGGDEFVVLLRRSTAELAQGTAERIIEAVAAPLDDLGGPSAVTVSIGLSMVANGESPLDAADKAMLSAKRKGRGRLAMALVADAS